MKVSTRWVGEEQDIGAHDGADRTGSPHQRQRRVGGEEPVGQGRDRAPEEVEGEEGEVPQPVLDIVAEDVEKEHVPQQMTEVAVQEGAGDQGGKLTHGLPKELPGDKGVLQDEQKGLAALQLSLEEEDPDVERNQDPDDHRRAVARVGVAQREHLSGGAPRHQLEAGLALHHPVGPDLAPDHRPRVDHGPRPHDRARCQHRVAADRHLITERSPELPEDGRAEPDRVGKGVEVGQLDACTQVHPPAPGRCRRRS